MWHKISELLCKVQREKLFININSKLYFFFPWINQVTPCTHLQCFISIAVTVLSSLGSVQISELISNLCLSLISAMQRLVSVNIESDHPCRLLASCRQLLASQRQNFRNFVGLFPSQVPSLTVCLPKRYFMLCQDPGQQSCFSLTLKRICLAGTAHCLAVGDDIVCLTYGAVSN